MAQLQTITSTEASALIQDLSPSILDLRDQASFEAAHVPGAQFLDDEQVMRLIKKGDKNKPVFLYCYKGNKSQTVGQMLIDFGFKFVFHLKDGFTGWGQNNSSESVAGNDNLNVPLENWLRQQAFPENNINAVDSNGQSPLIKACQLKDITMAKQLLEKGANIDQKDINGNQALWAACYSESMELIDLLLAHGANIDNQNESGATCLIYAASASKIDITKHLLSKGANPLLKTSDDFSALDLCVNKSCFNLLKAAQKSQ